MTTSSSDGTTLWSCAPGERTGRGQAPNAFATLRTSAVVSRPRSPAADRSRPLRMTTSSSDGTTLWSCAPGERAGRGQAPNALATLRTNSVMSKPRSPAAERSRPLRTTTSSSDGTIVM